MKYLIKITTNKGITYKYHSNSISSLDYYIGCVMGNELCPRRSIVKINTERIKPALKLRSKS